MTSGIPLKSRMWISELSVLKIGRWQWNSPSRQRCRTAAPHRCTPQSRVLRRACRRWLSGPRSPPTCSCLCPRSRSEWRLRDDTFTSSEQREDVTAMTYQTYTVGLCPAVTHPEQIRWPQTRRFHPWALGWRAGRPSSFRTAAGRDPAWWRSHGNAWAWQRRGRLKDVGRLEKTGRCGSEDVCRKCFYEL